MPPPPQMSEPWLYLCSCLGPASPHELCELLVHAAGLQQKSRGATGTQGNRSKSSRAVTAVAQGVTVVQAYPPEDITTLVQLLQDKQKKAKQAALPVGGSSAPLVVHHTLVTTHSCGTAP